MRHARLVYRVMVEVAAPKNGHHRHPGYCLREVSPQGFDQNPDAGHRIKQGCPEYAIYVVSAVSVGFVFGTGAGVRGEEKGRLHHGHAAGVFGEALLCAGIMRKLAFGAHRYFFKTVVNKNAGQVHVVALGIRPDHAVLVPLAHGKSHECQYYCKEK